MYNTNLLYHIVKVRVVTVDIINFILFTSVTASLDTPLTCPRKHFTGHQLPIPLCVLSIASPNVTMQQVMQDKILFSYFIALHLQASSQRGIVFCLVIWASRTKLWPSAGCKKTSRTWAATLTKSQSSGSAPEESQPTSISSHRALGVGKHRDYFNTFFFYCFQ